VSLGSSDAPEADARVVVQPHVLVEVEIHIDVLKRLAGCNQRRKARHFAKAHPADAHLRAGLEVVRGAEVARDQSQQERDAKGAPEGGYQQRQEKHDVGHVGDAQPRARGQRDQRTGGEGQEGEKQAADHRPAL
jgi:hypothetical protein